MGSMPIESETHPREKGEEKSLLPFDGTPQILSDFCLFFSFSRFLPSFGSFLSIKE